MNTLSTVLNFHLNSYLKSYTEYTEQAEHTWNSLQDETRVIFEVLDHLIDTTLQMSYHSVTIN